jgi:hypothetical protein
MLPSISGVMNLELIRDGGSLFAEFIDSQETTWSLFFRIKSIRPSPNEVENLGYEQPLLQRQESQTDAVSPGKQAVIDYEKVYEILSWAEAAEIAAAIEKKLSRNREEGWKNVFHAILYAARNSGAIAPGTRTRYPTFVL